MEVARYHGMTKQKGANRIAELLSYINLPGELLFRLPRELSGGQLQRLAIARALITAPAFIVADEPLSALDISVQAQLLKLLCELRDRFEMTMLFISHDIVVVKYLCDRVAVMYLGVLVEVAGAQELFENSLHPYTQALIAAAPRLDADRNEKREILEGDPAGTINALPGCPFAPRCRYCQDLCRRERPELVERGTEHWVACHVASP
jgi:oligopeptide/dipeptide ABC transporter ATP-binding protein